ncbi:DUF6711 family protein [Clostridium pasteurianum]|uniref:Prophage protein n=1 Tax=Clostridium pasteurianum BC1 TaxID=86416 RepID=R4K1J4_CLOPA|nr:DUF6711 family protein [Clostridium pasteurianum]AGK95636.1 hypothetical protein Clopa_0588 [Clostridium pasteurianum BC1]
MSFLINGVAVTAPKTFQVDLVDLDSDTTQRNAAGVLMRDRLRQMRKLQCEWGPLTTVEISTILHAVDPTSMPVTYPDPYAGSDQTRTFYAGDRTAPAFNFNSGQWLGLKFDLIEI